MDRRENPLFNITFNILIPIVVLNKGHLFLGTNQAVMVLIIALSFPIAYGMYDFIKNKKKNIISIFGVLNILLTGGLALFKLKGIWFAVKEAAVPLLIGIFVLISNITRKNFFEALIVNSSILNWPLIKEKIKSLSTSEKLKSLLKKATTLFSISFFISAILNFVLALYIFSEKNFVGLSEVEKEIILNKKIADMTWMGFVVIGLPMTLFSVFIFWWFLKRLRQLTELSLENLLSTSKK